MTDVSVPSEEAFRHEVLHFLEATLPTKSGGASGVVSFGGSGLSRSVAYQRQLSDAGLAGITWPAEYGGRPDAHPLEPSVVAEEIARARTWQPIGAASLASAALDRRAHV